MDDAEFEAGLRTLGYAREWIDCGFLDAELLRRQLLVFETGEDRNTEHYRYAAFCHVFERESLSDVELDRLLSLIAIDPDSAIATSAQCRLIDWHGLSSAQRRRLRGHALFSSGKLQRQFTIFDLNQRITEADIEDRFFDEVLAIGDESLQRRLTGAVGITIEQLEHLVDVCKSLAVRNMASARLRRMDAKSGEAGGVES